MHKRASTIRCGMFRIFDRVYYNAPAATTYLFERGKDRATLALTDILLAKTDHGTADVRMLAMFFGGCLRDWERPGFPMLVLRPFLRSLAKSSRWPL